MNLLDLKAQERSSIVGFNNRTLEKMRWAEIVFMVIDIILILLSTSVVFAIRFVPDLHIGSLVDDGFISLTRYKYFTNYVGFLVLYIAFIILLFNNYDLYSTVAVRLWLDEVLLVFKCISISALILMVVLYLSKQQISRFVVVSGWAINIIAVVGWRYVKHKIVERNIKNGNRVKSVLIVGAGKVGYKLYEILENNDHLGLKLKGFVDDYKEGEDILGKVNDVPRILQSKFIDEVFITIPSERELVKRVTKQALIHKANVRLIPDLFDGIVSLNRPMSMGFFGELPVMEIYRKPIPELSLFLKGAIDILVGFTMLVILCPVLLTIAFLIKIDSPDGPVIYTSRRVGKKGKHFNCYKFRTMLANADEMKQELRDFNEKSGPFFKIKDDPRITRIGCILRKYSIDELPQLFNLVIGNMSLVGPRPHPLDDFELYDIENYRRLDVKPGITSLWAVEARNDPSFERNMELDLYYIENWSIWLDLKIILKTIPTVLRGSGT